MTAVPAPGPHGGDGAAVARALGLDPETVLDLSMTLNPCAPDVAALVARHASAVGRYPDRSAATVALAEAMCVDAERLVLTNGGSEAIALVAGAIGGTVLAEPEFSLHPRGDGGPVWRSDPHSPSGRLAPAGQRADVWDEAFYPLATGTWSRGDANSVVVGSLTKVFACPGLRLGYVLADDAARLTAAQPAWPVSSVALAVLPDLLAAADLPAWQHAIAARRAELVALLARHGLAADAADAPWVLVTAPGLRERLAPQGIVVRDCASFGLPGVVRIAVPDDDGLARIEEALCCAAR
jgi:histidinol-phosphate/aromatic aminotransferase/cobyric acid decarboxylase-like protein